MVKNAIRRIVLGLFPELGQRKHLPQLARIEKMHDLPTGTSKVSTAFRAYKAADIQLLNAITGEPLATPVFEQVTLATGQAHDRGVFVEPSAGMHCLIQYIDGLNSLPVITAILPWQSLVPDNKSTDVVLQQSSTSKLTGSNEDWHLQTNGQIKQTSQKHIIASQVSEQSHHQRTTIISGHDISKIDGNQVNEVMGALKLLIGEKAAIVALDNLLLGSKKQVDIKSTENMTLESLKQFQAKAKELAKVQGAKVWLGSEGLNVVQVLVDLIDLVGDITLTLSTHTHPGVGPTQQAAVFTTQNASAVKLSNDLKPITA